MWFYWATWCARSITRSWRRDSAGNQQFLWNSRSKYQFNSAGLDSLHCLTLKWPKHSCGLDAKAKKKTPKSLKTKQKRKNKTKYAERRFSQWRSAAEDRSWSPESHKYLLTAAPQPNYTFGTTPTLNGADARPTRRQSGQNKALTVGGAAVPSPASVEVRRAVCRPRAALLLFIGLHLFRSRSIHLPTRSGHRLASAPATQILPRTNGRRCAPPTPLSTSGPRAHVQLSRVGGSPRARWSCEPHGSFPPPPVFSNME